ncbi:hypothetical protein ES703_08514 [subsurface metagenome]
MLKRIGLVFISLLILTLLFPASALAQPPDFPHQFYGTVTIGDQLAVGTTVLAKIGEVEASTTVDTKGRYGYSPNYGGTGIFMVPADDPDTTDIEGGRNGEIIEFYVAGVPATTFPFQIGGHDELDLNITGVLPPVAGFGASPLSGPEPLTVAFTDESLNMADNSPTWAWEFGDGETSTVQDPIHEYLQAGNYTVTLTVTTDEGSDMMKVENLITVTVPGDTAPTVISTSPTPGATGVGITTTVRATFSEVIKSDGTLVFKVSGVSGTTTSTDTTATFTPSANLGYSRTYTASVLASDLDDNPMAAAYSWSFTTRAKPATGGGGGGGFALDTMAPTMSNILASAITETGADISWRTNEWSTSQVEYWSSPGTLSPLDETMVIDHLVHLTDLTPGTAYHYKTMSKDRAGNLAVSDKDTFITQGEAPAAIFTSSALSISPSEVNIGETVTISVLVANTGTAAGDYVVMLKINDVAEAIKKVTVAAGASKEVIFTTSKDAGSYSVDVNGLSGSFTVKEEVAPAPPAPPPPAPPPEVKAPINWPLVGGIIGGVIIVGLLIFFLVVRRRAH